MAVFLAKFVLYMASYILLVGLSVLAMILGWGVQPQSWGWIAFGWLGIFVPAIIQVIAESLD